MSKRVKMFVMVMAMIMQVILFVLCSFTETDISNMTYLILWCVCAWIICKSGKRARFA